MPWFNRRGGPMMMMAAPAMANVRGPMIMEKSVAPPPTPAALAPVKTVRKHFPETWLWENTEVAYVTVSTLISAFKSFMRIKIRVFISKS